MNQLSRRPRVASAVPVNQAGRDWKVFFKRTIVLVFLFSLAVHLLLS